MTSRESYPRYAIKWVKLKKYCELSGDTMNAIKHRRARGDWIEGIHWTKRAGVVWINLDKVQAWVESDQNQSHVA